MTRPKFPIPGETVHHTRDTLERWCFLAPRPKLRDAAGYLYAFFCVQHGQQPHAEMLGPDGRSGVLTDLSGCRSDFFERYHFSLAVKWGRHCLEREGGVWDKKPPGDAVCLDFGAIEDALLETWARPLQQDLVERVRNYPGFMILPDHWGEKLVFHRPAGYPAHWPEVIVIIPMPPPQYRHWPLDEAKAYFDAKIRELERTHRRRRRERGIDILGRGRCVTLDPYARITDRPNARRDRWAAGSDRLVAAAKEAYGSKRALYDEGRHALKGGRTDALFPAGTFQIARRFPVRVIPVPAAPLTVIQDFVPRSRAPA
jgi:hypothetical protein